LLLLLHSLNDSIEFFRDTPATVLAFPNGLMHPQPE